MGEVVDIKQYLSSIAHHELEIALMKSLDALPVALSENEKQEIYLYAKRLWSDVKQMESDSLGTFSLEIPGIEEHRDQVNECINNLINPRTRMINNLVAELIVCKIKEIQTRQPLIS